MYLKPRPNLVIPDPEHFNLPMPPEGRNIEEPLTQYWARRLEDGDVEAAGSFIANSLLIEDAEHGN